MLLSAVGGIALSLAYGIQIKEINDPFIELAETAMQSASTAASVGSFLVNMIPVLKYVPEFMPGAGFQKKARIWRKLQENFRERPYLASIEAMVCVFHTRITISPKKSFFTRLLEGPDLHSHQWLCRTSTRVVILIINEK